jgi:transcriptional regulator GlxA family with amidase domain
MVFARAGTTFGEELMAVRLKQAHRLLSDCRFNDLPIGEISARCGFIEPSHFARRFKLRFRVSPTEFRRQMGPARSRPLE